MKRVKDMIVHEETGSFVGRKKGTKFGEKDYNDFRIGFTVDVRQRITSWLMQGKEKHTLGFDIVKVHMAASEGIREHIEEMCQTFSNEIAKAVIFQEPLTVESDKYICELDTVERNGMRFKIG